MILIIVSIQSYALEITSHETGDVLVGQETFIGNTNLTGTKLCSVYLGVNKPFPQETSYNFFESEFMSATTFNINVDVCDNFLFYGQNNVSLKINCVNESNTDEQIIQYVETHCALDSDLSPVMLNVIAKFGVVFSIFAPIIFIVLMLIWANKKLNE